MRKLLPVIAIVLTGCTSPLAQRDAQSPAYLTQESNYTADASALVAYRKANPTVDVTEAVVADSRAYSALRAARMNNYSPETLSALDAAISAYDATLIQKGIAK